MAEHTAMGCLQAELTPRRQGCRLSRLPTVSLWGVRFVTFLIPPDMCKSEAGSQRLLECHLKP